VARSGDLLSDDLIGLGRARASEAGRTLAAIGDGADLHALALLVEQFGLAITALWLDGPKLRTAVLKYTAPAFTGLDLAQQIGTLDAFVGYELNTASVDDRVLISVTHGAYPRCVDGGIGCQSLLAEKRLGGGTVDPVVSPFSSPSRFCQAGRWLSFSSVLITSAASQVWHHASRSMNPEQRSNSSRAVFSMKAPTSVRIPRRRNSHTKEASINCFPIPCDRYA
jgi:hypothetical protein